MTGWVAGRTFQVLELEARPDFLAVVHSTAEQSIAVFILARLIGI
jgi:hypothetical protein